MARRLTPAEKRAREAEKAYKRALTVSVVSGDAGDTERELARLKAEAAEARKLADEDAKLAAAAKDAGVKVGPEPQPKGSTGKAKPKGNGRAKGVGRKGTKRVQRGPIGRAVSDVSQGGEQAAASSIRSAGDLFWLWLTFALAIGLLATAVRNPDRLRAGWEQIGDVVARFINPWSADEGDTKRMSTTTSQPARLIRV